MAWGGLVVGTHHRDIYVLDNRCAPGADLVCDCVERGAQETTVIGDHDASQHCPLMILEVPDYRH
jgi:hypothetical protein